MASYEQRIADAISAGDRGLAEALIVEANTPADQRGELIERQPRHNVGLVSLVVTSTRTEDIPQEEAEIINEILDEAAERFQLFVEGEIPHLKVMRKRF